MKSFNQWFTIRHSLDASLLNDSNMISAHIQNTTFFHKHSAISIENISGDATFPRLLYPLKISGVGFGNRRYSYGKTVIPPFRFSIAINNASKRLTKNKSYYREFSYCGRVWRFSMSKFREDDSMLVYPSRDCIFHTQDQHTYPMTNTNML
ncbi:unnamed protein product [Ambrosiozyma monospora]|uniref:Unnamed protein product n=1 Tax=Ambrosiozyma monospora TaxID=43982 RepID=A0ACB5T8L6_AMBMO|nr:unnamed protein product [Ambrosiozyma monospora]